MASSGVSSQCRLPCCCFWGKYYLIKAENPCGSWLGNQTRKRIEKQNGRGKTEHRCFRSSEWLVPATSSIQVCFLLSSTTGLVSSKISLGMPWGHLSSLIEPTLSCTVALGGLQPLLKQLDLMHLTQKVSFGILTKLLQTFFHFEKKKLIDWSS